ncbi:hypothetical protein [Microbulbifer sp. ALW1]|uniref:hypothetical protein n=1 Tax=Microbulbifer sp. (strain ALW1) TaxID=1516059 RepID=UPI00135BDBD1|nr:hypothetical protein [Microbulbifer sp. ALW1]
MTVTPFECWSLEDVWDYRHDTLNPFWMYSLVFLLLLIWSFVELLIGVFSKSLRFVPFVSLFLMISVLFGHLHFWQSFKILREEEEFSYFTLKLVHFVRPQPEERLPGAPPSWQEYLIQNRCNKGLAISNMSEQEHAELRKSFLELWE